VGGRKKGQKKGTGKGQLSVAVEATSATPAAAAAATTSSAAVEGCYVGKKKKNAGGAAILAKLQQTGCPCCPAPNFLSRLLSAHNDKQKRDGRTGLAAFCFLGKRPPPFPTDGTHALP
jgi:hypothetical protein